MIFVLPFEVISIKYLFLFANLFTLLNKQMKIILILAEDFCSNNKISVVISLFFNIHRKVVPSKDEFKALN